MNKLLWNDNNNYLSLNYADFKLRDKIACFDLDGTLIKTKSGKIFAKNENDWIYFNNSVIQVLKNLYDDNFCIVIITNQAGLSDLKQIIEWKNKIGYIVSNMNFPIMLYASISHDQYRKPLPTFYMNLLNNNCHNNESFYCGDAAGRIGDHNDTDYKFALNCNLKFKIPEELFLDKIPILPVIKYPAFDEIKSYKLDKNMKDLYKNNDMVLIVGQPGSGKSTYVNDRLLPLGYYRINQDELKTKSKCLKETEKLLKEGKSVVIDNTNSKKESREEYIKLAKKYNYTIRCIIMDVSMDYAKHNAVYRSYKSNGQINFIPSIVYNMYKKNYVEPNIDEGFTEILKVKPYTKAYENDYLMYLY